MYPILKPMHLSKNCIACRGSRLSSVRPFYSSISIWKDRSASQGCPVTGSRRFPTLQHIPSLPIIGSVLLPSFVTGIQHSILDGYKYFTDVRKSYGDFYTLGIPSIGSKNDSRATVHIINDPKEFNKVIRAGGLFPGGLVESLWVIKEWTDAKGITVGSVILGNANEEWRRVRTFLQKDLLHPDSAKEYLPGIIQAAEIASKGAIAFSNKENVDLKTYFNYAAFDMFSAVAFGEMTKIASSEVKSDPEYEIFCKMALEGLSTAVLITMNPIEKIYNMIGITTSRQQHCYDCFDEMWEISGRKVQGFMDRKDKGQLSDFEESSYLAKAINRQMKEDSNMSLKEVQELVAFMMFVAVDSTSSIICWNICHIARSPHVQEKLYNELSHAVKTIGGGKLTAEVLEKKNSPYLHAVIRETQRITPALTIITKTVKKDIEINGVRLPEGTAIGFEGYTSGMDPKTLENPDEFIPERWSVEAEAARKGTHNEFIDHAFFKEPFSQGPRKCPGSRVAKNEIQCFLAQLVLDWKLVTDELPLEDIKYKRMTFYEVELPSIEFQKRH